MIKREKGDMSMPSKMHPLKSARVRFSGWSVKVDRESPRSGAA